MRRWFTWKRAGVQRRPPLRQSSPLSSPSPSLSLPFPPSPSLFSPPLPSLFSPPLPSPPLPFPSPHLSSPNFTAFSTPTAAVVSGPFPTWSAWQCVRSSKRVSRFSFIRGPYNKLWSSEVPLCECEGMSVKVCECEGVRVYVQVSVCASVRV